MTVDVRGGSVFAMTPTTENSAKTTVVTGVGLREGWWAPGLALHERGRPAAGGVAILADVPDQDDLFALRAAGLGLDGAALRALRDEPPAELAARVSRPDWVTTAERVVRSARPVAGVAELGETWREGFGRVLRPFLDDAARQVAAGARTDQCADLAAVAASVTATLARHLVDLASRALVTELHRWRAEGRLTGADGRERFLDFVRGVAAPDGLAELLTRYPVLARLLAQATTATAATTLELLARLATDRALVVEHLLDGTDPGPVVAVDAGQGDRHHGGRTVSFVDFADGSRVVYKPRDVTTHVRVHQFLDLLAAALPGLCPRAAHTLSRPGYGWSEFVRDAEVPDHAGADRFYRRQGALLALLHLLRATDMHYENLIAGGDTPVLIDTETLFHAELMPAGGTDPATDKLATSVYRTGLLPLMVVGEEGIADLSGIGGDRGGHSPSSVISWLDAGTDQMRLSRQPVEMRGSANRPRQGGVDIDPAGHEAAMLAGFRHAYDAIAARRDDFAALISSCAELTVRVVPRPTWVYGTLLDETTHPSVLSDALDRDEAFAVLFAGRVANPMFAQLLRHEIAALWDGDVPVFVTSAGSGRLRTPDGPPLPVPLPRSGVSAAIETLAGLSEVDRTDQEWIISATMATRGGTPAHPPAAPVPDARASSVVHPDGLVAAACAVADRLVARAISDDDRVNWLGLEAVDERQWLVLPLGASLGSGYLGVALFLSQLTAVTGIGRYADQARRAVADIPAMVDTFVERPDLAQVAGWGGLTGLGGITYGLSRLGTLLDDHALWDCAARLVGLAAGSAPAATELGWASGLAGCLGAMTAVRDDLGLDEAGAVARDCADRLAELADQDTALPLGFADGLAGIGWALATLGPDPAHHEAGRRVAARVTDRSGDAPRSGGWCGGAGFALARAVAPGLPAPPAVPGMPVTRDLSLCHGEMGVIEVLGELAGPAGPDARHSSITDPALRGRAGQALDVLRRHGPGCGAPGTVPTPGLLTGLAGIGYGLLRLASPGEVPSVLLLRANAPQDSRRR